MTAISGAQTRPLSDSNDSLLRFAMRADATLTGVMGLAVAVAADPVSRLTGLTSAQEYSMGAFFVLYGLAVFSLAALPNLRRAGLGRRGGKPGLYGRGDRRRGAGADDVDRSRRDPGQRPVHPGLRRAAIPGSAPPYGVTPLPAERGCHRLSVAVCGPAWPVGTCWNELRVRAGPRGPTRFSGVDVVDHKDRPRICGVRFLEKNFVAHQVPPRRY